MFSQNTVLMVGYVGAAANWLIPLATVRNLVYQPAENIDPLMSATLAVYSGVFIRWAIAISPANYPLCACHVTNATAQALTALKYTTATPKAVVEAPPATKAE